MSVTVTLQDVIESLVQQGWPEEELKRYCELEVERAIQKQLLTPEVKEWQ
jgi:hypothetical protein